MPSIAPVYRRSIFQVEWLIATLNLGCIKGPGKRGHIVADTLLPTQMFPRLPARATFVADTNFVSGTQKMFLILFRNILCPQQMFPSLRCPRNIMGNNVPATMCPRLPGPLKQAHSGVYSHVSHGLLLIITWHTCELIIVGVIT